MQPPFASVGAVLFDFDGTLVHSEIDFGRMRREVLALAAAEGLDPDGLGCGDVLSLIAEIAAQLQSTDAFRGRAEAALTEIEMEACAEARVDDAAIETLKWLRTGGIRVGIVTRNCRRAVEHLLSRFPLHHEVLLTRGETPRVKPDPIHLHLALERLGVPPAAAVMVGDHPMDIQAGRAAGMGTLGILSRGESRERSPDYFAEVAPDGVIRCLSELRAWIKLDSWASPTT